MKQTKMEVGTCHQVIRSEVELGDGGGGGKVDHVASHPLSVMQKMQKKKKRCWKRLTILANRGKPLDSYLTAILVWVIASVSDIRVFN